MPATGDLKDVLTHQTLRKLAGPKSFERGAGYFAAGQVMSLVEHDGKLAAVVEGSEEYRVTLFVDDDMLASDCTCPMGLDGVFCKHCVAVGLAWLANTPGSATKKSENGPAIPVVTLDDARVWLTKQDKDELVKIILDQAAEDAHLRERLLLQAAKSAGKGANVAAIRKAIDRATRTGGFVDYRAAYGFSLGINQVVDSIADMLEQGFATEVIDLVEHALGRVEDATLHMDDSDGNMGGMLSQLQEIHLAACQKAKPDPEELAARLFKWEQQTHFDTFYGAAGTYAELLGKRGLDAYRRHAEAAWASVPQTGPGKKDPEEYGASFRITHIMETLARQSGDIEALVAIKARNLSSAYAFLQIAEIYRDAKQHDQAMDWAERGIKAFPERVDSRLREFLANEYHRCKRHDEALQLIWTDFTENTGLATYQKLKNHADRIEQWSVWRDQALAFIRAEIEREKKQNTRRPVRGWGWQVDASDHSLLVEIFLWEKDAESAWREAQTGGCHDSWWMQLAAQRENKFPADVIPIYQKQVENLINQKNNGSYAEAVKLLRRIRDLMERLQRTNEFAGYLATVRAAHKPKRNFIKLAERL
ncbi:MAG: SWIM zinc finger family protein [Verrucomicrobiae bacterium]|nr:SWIM zinc finger family protein [Verrucomicrobiae bacterium]